VTGARSETPDPDPQFAGRIRFVLDGKLQSIDGVDRTTTVLEYLREHLQRTGTKEGCAEGDCGACTVVLGNPNATGTEMEYRTVNSCIRFLPTINGRELITVESLRRDGQLHPAQQAMIDHHGSQCGFCTPGFVMSLYALYLRTSSPQREQVIEAISGNLCRCTGYRPIIQAGMSMAAYPQSTAPAGQKSLDLLRGQSRPLRLPGFYAPYSVDELASELERVPEALLLAGGTDIGLWVTKQLRDLPHIIYIGEVAELREVRREADYIDIGAAVSLTDAWSVIVSEYAELEEIALRFASPPVRNSGTLCGNLANGSPIGDGIPVLMMLDARLQLRRGSEKRQLSLEEFYLDYKKTALAPAEFVSGVRIPIRRPGTWISAYKLSKRYEQDISAVSMGLSMNVNAGKIATARIACGGLAGIVARARRAEEALKGQPWTEGTFEAAIQRLAEDFKPMSDMRASSSYRLKTAGSLLRRFFFEHTPGGFSTRVTGLLEAGR
jgi:xanthine dehydrogenase small subunit